MIQNLRNEEAWIKKQRCLTGPRRTKGQTDSAEQHNNWNEKHARTNRVTKAEQMSEPEDRMMVITTEEQNKEKWNEDSLRGLWDNIKCTNICFIGVSEEKEKDERSEKIFEGL